MAWKPGAFKKKKPTQLDRALSEAKGIRHSEMNKSTKIGAVFWVPEFDTCKDAKDLDLLSECLANISEHADAMCWTFPNLKKPLLYDDDNKYISGIILAIKVGAT